MARSNTGSTSNWMSTATSPITVDSTPHTISCWFYPANLTATMNLVVIGDDAAAVDYSVLVFDGANALGLGDDVVRMSSSTSANNKSAVSTAAVSAVNTWNHAAGIVASTTSRSAFLNGGNKGTDGGSCPINADVWTSLDVGAYRVATTISPINGRIQEVAVWNVALTDAEIAALGKRISPLLVRPASLIFYAPIIGRKSPEPDLIGGRNLTISGTMAQAEHAPMVYPSRPLWHMGTPPPPPEWPPPGSPEGPKLRLVQSSLRW